MAPEQTAEQTYDAFSTLNENDQPYLGTCTLIVGDGTMKVDFNNGRAKVPASFAHLVARHPNIEIPAFAAEQDAEAHVDEDAAPDVAVEVGESDGERREATAEEIELAKEHLAAEGVEIPEVEVADTGAADASVPGRFEATVTDGQPRCQAAKRDGTQCANPAADGSQACKLGKHQEQLA